MKDRGEVFVICVDLLDFRREKRCSLSDYGVKSPKNKRVFNPSLMLLFCFRTGDAAAASAGDETKKAGN